MPETRIGLDNPAFAGRVRSRRIEYMRRPLAARGRTISDVMAPLRTSQKPAAAAAKKPNVQRSPAKQLAKQLERSHVLKRQVVGRPKVAKRRKRTAGGLQGKILTAMAVVLFLCGLGVGGLQFKTNQQVKGQVKVLAAQTSDSGALSGEVPSEDKPTGNITQYKVAPLSPKLLRIGKINVETRIARLGVGANNELKAPANIHDAGWYEGSARPGEAGAVLLDGHVHGPTLPGVFANLKKLAVGDKISVERGDGKQFTYRVVRKESYDVDKVDMGAAFSSAQPGKPGLNMITCDGSFDKAGNYNKRLVVFAVQD